MRSLLVAVLLTWVALVLEITFPAHIPGGSLIFPIACSICLWFRSTFGMLLCGVGLIVDAIVRPAPFPWVGVVIPLLAAFFCRGDSVQSPFRKSRGWRLIPRALELPVLVLGAVCFDQAIRVPLDFWSFDTTVGFKCLERLLPILMIALPLSGLGSLLIRVADEFGLRRLHSRMSVR